MEAVQEALAPRDEEFWRRHFAGLRAAIELLKSERDEFEQALDRARGRWLQYSSFTNYSFEQFYRGFTGDLEKQILALNREIQQAESQLDTAKDELRRSGGPPGWAR